MSDFQNFALAALSPFGLVAPYRGAGVDTTISGNTTITNQFQQYRDLTINAGIVLTAGFSPQIIICRVLTFGSAASQISADGLGGTGGTGSSGTGGGAGQGGQTPETITANQAGTQSQYFAAKLFANGGTGQNIGTIGGAGSAAGASPILQYMSMFQFGCIGGGGGGAGGGGTTSGSLGNGGQRGGGGAAGGNGAGGGGGSGIGGGAGGGGNKSGGTSGTGGAGGAGGGVVIILCDDIQGSAGLITANGLIGGSAVTGGGGGGGGGGGLVLVFSRTATVNPTLQANGGSAGSGTALGSNGGVGGAGLTQLIESM